MANAAWIHNTGKFEGRIEAAYAQEEINRINAKAQLSEHVISDETIAENPAWLQDIEYVFSTWGMLQLNAEQIAKLPKLKGVFYAAGSVKGFAKPFLDAGIKVCSAWRANAMPVAEFTVAHMVLSQKNYLGQIVNIKNNGKAGFQHHNHALVGFFRRTIALIGLGEIGCLVAERLKTYDVNVIAYDPYCSDEKATALNVTLVSLDECFSQADIVSLHAPNLESTKNMLRGSHFEQMKEKSTFINTARGAIIDEPEMVEVLTKRQDITAILDVTYPEPPVPESTLWTLPNVYLSPHVAGSTGDEVLRMGSFMVDEFERFINKESQQHEVTLELFDRLA